MTKSRGNIVASCPNCGGSISDEHPYAWCSNCGKPLPAEVTAKLVKVQAARESPAATPSSSRRQFWEHKYSTFWPRFWAGFIDGLVFLPWGLLRNWTFAHSTPVWLRACCYVIDTGVFTVYSILMHGYCGQTLGKMVCKVIVRDVTEAPLSMRQAVLRDIFGVVIIPFSLATELPFVLGGQNPYSPEHLPLAMWISVWFSLIWFMVELATMLTNEKRRALHDFIAGSVVIRTAYVPRSSSTAAA